MASRGAPPGMGQVMVLSTCAMTGIVIVTIVVICNSYCEPSLSFIRRLTVLQDLSFHVIFIDQCYLVFYLLLYSNPSYVSPQFTLIFDRPKDTTTNWKAGPIVEYCSSKSCCGYYSNDLGTQIDAQGNS